MEWYEANKDKFPDEGLDWEDMGYEDSPEGTLAAWPHLPNGTVGEAYIIPVPEESTYSYTILDTHTMWAGIVVCEGYAPTPEEAKQVIETWLASH